MTYHQVLYWCDKFSKKLYKLTPVDVSSLVEPMACNRLSKGQTLESLIVEAKINA